MNAGTDIPHDLRDPPLTDAQLDALLSQLDAEIHPGSRGVWGQFEAHLSALPTRYRILFCLLIAPVATALVWLLAARPAVSEDEGLHLLWVGGALTLPLPVLFALAQRPWQRPSVSRGLAWGGVAASCLLAVGLATRPLWPLWPGQLVGGSTPATLPVWREVLPCMIFGLAVAAPVFALSKLLDRGTPHSTWLALAAAGLAGNLALLAHCGHERAGHLLLGHASIGPVLLLAALVVRGSWGAVARRRTGRAPRA